MEKVSIKVLPHPEHPQLSMKYVGAREYLSPKIAPDGKLITGLDENALEVNRIEDAKERERVKKEIKKEREELSRLMNQDLDTTSSYWDTFFVVMEDELELDLLNPLHRVIERFLVANGYVAPSREAIELDERYHNCVYYLFREEQETTKKAKKQMERDKATATLFRLNEENPSKLKMLVAYIFGYNADEVTMEAAYVKLKEFIEASEIKDETAKARAQTRNVTVFLEAAGKSNEVLTTKLLLDRAIKKRVVSVKGGVHRIGDTILGGTYDEAIEFLSSAENSVELISLKKQVANA